MQGLDVAVHDHVPGAFVDFLYRAENRVGSRVVDQDVQPAKFVLGALNQGLEIGYAPNVGGHRNRFAAYGLHRRHGFGHGIGFSGGDHDIRAVLRQPKRDGTPNPPTTAGHDGHFVFERKISNGHRRLLGANGPGLDRGGGITRPIRRAG